MKIIENGRRNNCTVVKMLMLQNNDNNYYHHRHITVPKQIEKKNREPVDYSVDFSIFSIY